MYRPSRNNSSVKPKQIPYKPGNLCDNCTFSGTEFKLNKYSGLFPDAPSCRDKTIETGIASAIPHISLGIYTPIKYRFRVENFDRLDPTYRIDKSHDQARNKSTTFYLWQFSIHRPLSMKALTLLV